MNKAPKFVNVILLLLVAAGIGAWAWKTFGPGANTEDQQKQPTTAESAARTPAEEPARLVVVTYFTSDQRCPTCLKIEKQTREAVEGGFAKELADGVLRFQTLNMDRAENKHFVGDYVRRSLGSRRRPRGLFRLHPRRHPQAFESRDPG